MARWLHLFLRSFKCQLNKHHMDLSAWLLWVKLRQTGRPRGDLQITIPLCKPHWDCYLQFNCTSVYLHVPSLITVDLACMYFWTFNSCPVLPSLESLLLPIHSVAAEKCPGGRLTLIYGHTSSCYCWRKAWKIPSSTCHLTF